MTYQVPPLGTLSSSLRQNLAHSAHLRPAGDSGWRIVTGCKPGWRRLPLTARHSATWPLPRNCQALKNLRQLR